MPSSTMSDVAKGILIFAVGVSIIIAIWQGFAWYYNEMFDKLMKFPYPAESFQRLYEYVFENRTLLGRTLFP